MPGRDSGGALRRVVLAGLAYGALAGLAGLPLVELMHRAFLLPSTFLPLARGLLVVVGVVVLLAAWRYPEMGQSSDGGEEGRRR